MSHLDNLKKLDLFEYLTHHGFTPERGARVAALAAQKTIILRKGDCKIAIKLHMDGHWTYINCHAPSDCGSIIDWRMRHEGMSFGLAVRSDLFLPTAKKIINDASTNSNSINGDAYITPSERWNKCRNIDRWDYLVNRGLEVDLIKSLNIDSIIKQNTEDRIVFRHDSNKSQPCGFEIKGENFTGFCPNGEKGLFWVKPKSGSIKRIAFAETAIDALSLWQIERDTSCALASFAGNMSNKQRILINLVMKKYSTAEIIVATDADCAGDRYFTFFNEAAPTRTKRARPPHPHKDWNDVLMSS